MGEKAARRDRAARKAAILSFPGAQCGCGSVYARRACEGDTILSLRACCPQKLSLTRVPLRIPRFTAPRPCEASDHFAQAAQCDVCVCVRAHKRPRARRRGEYPTATPRVYASSPIPGSRYCNFKDRSGTADRYSNPKYRFRSRRSVPLRSAGVSSLRSARGSPVKRKLLNDRRSLSLKRVRKKDVEATSLLKTDRSDCVIAS